ncbi:hypothetical protein [Dyadobacter psychrophilus]|uniref:Uncharacterized protein n=1 Tax=Dyadobacter psychrophilus TaxID=651661 RepID=A0A1T5H2N5_9BACT|nr:hypothetical protein [Dyadobacter psychrophilus]SKC14935.1 hypothetical protein SAMN05660293_04762 [Dyadobacter psychrophilus]
MKAKSIKFFSPQENLPKSEVTKSKPKPSGYISATGKIVLPVAALEELGIEAESTRFKIGTDQGKRKINTVYLIPASDGTDSFELVKSGRGYVIPLAIILKQGGVAYDTTKYTFTATPFNYEEGVVGYELALASSEPKPAYTGKPRGRKPKAVEQAG